MNKAIAIKSVTKRYRLYNNAKERLLNLISPGRYGREFYALRDVSFEVEKGEVVGFIGINGSGKSTLSNIIAGIIPETSGFVKVNGETSLIAVAAGLKEELTGRDNIELKCLMLGFTKREIKKMESAIIEFSELGHFINQPVKSYSSGMKSRLGFAISVNINPEILIIDEALSVGDKAFAEKSLNRMREFKDLGKTMIFVSHSIGQMKKFCEKILWLEFGQVRDYGLTEQIIPKYEKFLSEWQEMSKEEKMIYKDDVLHQNERKPLYLQRDAMSANEVNKNNVYTENPVSRMGHIKSGVSHIYLSPQTMSGGLSSEEYKHSSYYIKRVAFYNNKRYFLLSNHPSAVKGVVGWMEASRITSHLHILIDRDKKEFTVHGTGAGYNRPWGGEKNLVFTDLNHSKDYEFRVEITEKIENDLWYYGILRGEFVWIHANHLKSK